MMKSKHHILHNRQEWSLRPEAKRLRENPKLIATIDRETHTELHEQCPPVPLLGYYALMRVNSVFYPAYTTDQTLDNLCFAIEQANKAPKCHPIEKELGELAIEAIDLQRPYLESAQENAAVVDLSRYRKVVRL
jgi:hypothetical protein